MITVMASTASVTSPVRCADSRGRPVGVVRPESQRVGARQAGSGTTWTAWGGHQEANGKIHVRHIEEVEHALKKVGVSQMIFL